MTARSTAATLVPPAASLDELARIAASCTACDLHRLGTQTVFGEGPADAAVVLGGEQPGDREDVEGHAGAASTPPNRIESRACLPWLHAELARTTPDVLVTLGATATTALLSWEVRVTAARGRLHLGPERGRRRRPRATRNRPHRGGTESRTDPEEAR